MAALGAACAGRAEEPDTVVVPGVRGAGIEYGFKRLRQAGLRVEIPQPFEVYSLNSQPMVLAQSPERGATVAEGSLVRITRIGNVFLGLPASRPHTVTVPNLVGKSVGEAVEWVDAGLWWDVHFPPLPASSAQSLFEAYFVTAQEPAPGSRLSPGVLTGKGFRPTPVLLRAAARRTED